MKKNLILLTIVLLSVTSCATTSYYESGYSLDFREYVKDPNFTINPTNIGNKDFTPIGIINLEFHVGNDVEDEYKNHVREVGDMLTGKYYVPTFDRMISLSVEKAKEMGANGIISFNIKKERSLGNEKLPIYEVSGVTVIYE